MDTSSFESPPPEVLLSRQDGRTPRAVNPPVQCRRLNQKLKKSTYYGILLYILDQDRGRLSENQIVWIIYYSRKLDESQLSRSVGIYKQLKFNESFLSRMKHDVERIRSNVPRLEPKILPERRRIGTGYRDKGSLRPLHEKRTIGERAIWDEDIVYLLPLNYQVRGTWLTAEEVCELVGVDHLQLVLHQLKTESLQESVRSFKVD